MLRKIDITNKKIVYKQKKVSLEKVKGWIVEGDILHVTDDGLECTKDFLLEITFGKFISCRSKTKDALMHCLSVIFSEERLYNFLENGGIETWAAKKQKGLLNEDA